VLVEEVGVARLYFRKMLRKAATPRDIQILNLRKSNVVSDQAIRFYCNGCHHLSGSGSGSGPVLLGSKTTGSTRKGARFSGLKATMHFGDANSDKQA
jgi:hypothetical protein